MENKSVILPKWLDDLIFGILSAQYSKKNKDLVVLEWEKEEILCYLGTYFPRSFAESYHIFSTYFFKYKSQYQDKTTISLFDFGCGTGGELIGFIVAISEILPNIKVIELRALDGNVHELRYLEIILKETASITGVLIESRLMPIVIEDFYDMKVVTDVIAQKYDFVISFKAICEFVTKKQFAERNPYEHIINTFLPKLSDGGIKRQRLLSFQQAVLQIYQPFMPSGFLTAWKKAIAYGIIRSINNQCTFLLRIVRLLFFGQRIPNRYCRICTNLTSLAFIIIFRLLSTIM